ncbi:hypothetical protein PV11_06670 [Exophiala sideris]|uniref:Serine aminopeptidase S33 domain-containing protein n=1 Tax=Exophiala sideris TaxID=1016849 RepID=A0A0D1YE97_9EURO|nr:hypothetical protein PV11_06670 [Exophiala sideris]
MPKVNPSPSPLPLPKKRVSKFGNIINEIFDYDRGLAAEKAMRKFMSPPRVLPGRRERAILQSATVTEFQVNGLSLKRYVWQNRAGPSPYVMLGHGFMISTASMLNFVRPLLRAGFSVVAWDQPAHGQSEGDLTYVQAWADSFAINAQTYTPVAGVIGFSLSGTCALMSLVENPSFNICPALVCINSPRQIDTVLQGFMLKHGIPLSLMQQMHEWAFSNRLRLPRMDQPFMEHCKGLSKTRCLFIQDHNDPVASEAEAKYWASMVQHSTLKFTYKLKHQGALSNDPLIEEVVKFIQGHSVSQANLRSSL